MLIDCPLICLQERQYHNKAIDYFYQALKALKRPSTHPQVWNLVTEDLASASLTFASLLQEHLIGSTMAETDEFRIVELLGSALKHYEERLKTCDGADVQRVHCRIASVHHRMGKVHLASMHAGRPRLGTGVQLLKLAGRHLSKAASILSQYDSDDSDTSAVAVLLDLLVLLVPLDGSQNSNVKNLEGALYALVTARPLLRRIASRPASTEPGDNMASLEQLKRHLSIVLRELVRSESAAAATSASTSKPTASVFKDLYQACLKNAQVTHTSAAHLAGSIADILEATASSPIVTRLQPVSFA